MTHPAILLILAVLLPVGLGIIIYLHILYRLIREDIDLHRRRNERELGEIVMPQGSAVLGVHPDGGIELVLPDKPSLESGDKMPALAYIASRFEDADWRRGIVLEIRSHPSVSRSAEPQQPPAGP